jgi:hypothetical protein
MEKEPTWYKHTGSVGNAVASKLASRSCRFPVAESEWCSTRMQKTNGPRQLLYVLESEEDIIHLPLPFEYENTLVCATSMRTRMLENTGDVLTVLNHTGVEALTALV